MKDLRSDEAWTIIAIVLLIVVTILFATTLANNSSLNEENKQLSKQVDKYQQKALDWQTKAEDAEIKLVNTEADLQLCSQQIEQYETDIFVLEERIKELEDEVKTLEEIIESFNHNDWHYDYTDEDVEILAGVMYGENYISGTYEMMLTGSVVLNRVVDIRFPNTIKKVVYQKDGKYEQYAPRTKNLLGSDEVPKICYTLARILLEYGSIAPKNVIYQAHFKQGTGVFWEKDGEYFCFG